MVDLLAVPPLLLAALLAQAQAPDASRAEKTRAPEAATLLTLDGGVAVQLLELSRRATKESPTGRLNVGYWTGPDADVLSTEAGRELEFLRASEVFKAFRAWAPANGVTEVVLSAVAGRPGGAGRILDVTWIRGASGDWGKGSPGLRETTLPSFPALGPPIVRDSDEETVIAFMGLVYGGVLDARQYDQAVKLMRPDLANSIEVADFARAMEALERVYGKVKERKPLAWFYPVDGGRMSADAQTMVRFSTVSEFGQGTEDVTFGRERGGDWKLVGYQRWGQLGAERGGDRRTVPPVEPRPDPARPVPSTAYEITGIRAFPWYHQDGRFGDEDLLTGKYALWNVMIGKGDIPRNTEATLVVAEVCGPTFLAEAEGQVVLTARTERATLAKATVAFSRLFTEGYTVSVPLLVPGTGCEFVTVSASVKVKGKTVSTMNKTIEFRCGE